MLKYLVPNNMDATIRIKQVYCDIGNKSLIYRSSIVYFHSYIMRLVPYTV